MERGVHLFLALAFVAFAYLNLNDPDPLVWVIAYGAVALLHVAAAFGRGDRRVSGVLGLVFLVWACTLVPGMIDWFRADMPTITGSMKATEPHIEVVREFLGLAIALGAVAWTHFRTPRSARLF